MIPYMDDLYRLKYIIRYSNYKRITDEDVAQHSFYVASICILLWTRDYPKADIGDILLMANIHDWPEVQVDDVSHKVKRDFPDVAKALKAAESEVMSAYPIEIGLAYDVYEHQNVLEAQIVKLADIMQCLQYLESEAQLGNDTLGTLHEESTESYYKLKGEIDEHYKRVHSTTTRL